MDTLAHLASEPDKDLVVRYFELRLLDLVGFQPQLFQCLGCGAEILPQDQFFSAQQGGVLCPRCGPGVSDALPISMPALKLLRHYQRSSFLEAKRLSLRSGINQEIEMIIQHYLTYLLERSLNTPPFIRKLKHENKSLGNQGNR